MAVSKTALGAQVMKDRSVSLTAQQRSALILCDGKRSAEEVVRMTAAVGVTMADVAALSAMGLVQLDSGPAAAVAAQPNASGQAPLSMPGAASAVGPGSDIDFPTALNAAITLCSNLGFKGFGLNMALTGVDSLEKLQKLAPEIRRTAGDAKYKPLHAVIFGKPL